MPNLETVWIETEHAAHRMADALRSSTDAATRRELGRQFDETKEAWRAAARRRD